MAVLISRLFSKYLISGEDTPFVMELPPYRFPTAKAMARHTWEKGKQYLKTLEKYYIVDIGMRYMLLGSRQADAGHVLENIVYLELLRRGYDVYVGKINSYEVDFVAQNKKGTVYFQVALTVRDENTLLRELRPLQAIRDHYPKIILTMDEEPEEQYEGIRRINARDWLLGIVD